MKIKEAIELLKKLSKLAENNNLPENIKKEIKYDEWEHDFIRVSLDVNEETKLVFGFRMFTPNEGFEYSAVSIDKIFELYRKNYMNIDV